MKREDMIIEKGISDIVGVFCDPIVVYPGGWADTLPPWIKEAITFERLIENVRALKEGNMTATDAEACAYLYTLCLCMSLSHDWTHIYQYLVTKVSERHRKEVTVPEDVRVDSLNKEQMRDLQQLKDDIYRTRTKARLEKDRTERRQKREAEKERRRQEQPALFEL